VFIYAVSFPIKAKLYSALYRMTAVHWIARSRYRSYSLCQTPSKEFWSKLQ